MTPHILVVDDEPGIRQLLGYLLAREGYSYDEVGNTRDAEYRMKQRKPDLILLDWMLPGVSGLDWLRRLRRESSGQTPPVIFLTARTTETDTVSGLEAGGDDYVTKPFSNRELIARIQSVLRRDRGQASPEEVEAPLTFGPVLLDHSTHRATVNGTHLKLNRKEFQLLYFFATHTKRVYSRQQILDHVWGIGHSVSDRTVDVHVRRLRRGLTAHGADHLIKTVWGVGYTTSPDNR